MSFDRFLLSVESRDLSQAITFTVYYKSVFFPKLSDGYQNFLFLSINNWGLNFLQNKCSQSSQIYLNRKTEKNVYFLMQSFLIEFELTKIAILPNCQIVFFSSKTVNFNIHCFEKEDPLIILVSPWERSCYSTAKRNLSKDM